MSQVVRLSPHFLCNLGHFAEGMPMLDRRTKRRFPIQLDLLYRVHEGRRSATLGIGKTIDISSRGMIFRSDKEVPPGTRLEVSTSWPAMLHGTCPMRWVVFGNVVRSQDGMTACTIDRCEFKTQGRIFPLPATQPAGYAPKALAALTARA